MMNNVFFGIVENRDDPLRLGRCKVRIFGVHSESKVDIPTEDLPWATPIMPLTGASVSGIGHSPTGPVESSIVALFFQDPDTKQIPVMFGTVCAVPHNKVVFSGIFDEDEEITFTKPDVDLSTVTTGSGGTLVSSDNTPVVTQTELDEKTAKEVAPKELSGWTLGDTSKFFESGKSGPAAINAYNGAAAGDLGGASYGTYQFASFLPAESKVGDKLITRTKSKGSPLAQFISKSRFKPLLSKFTPATPEFDSMWIELAKNSDFAVDQHDYVQSRYYDPAVVSLKKAGFDASKYGPAVQDLIWSTAVQLGPGKSTTDIFINGLGEKLLSASEVEVITLVSDYKIANVKKFFVSSSENIQRGVASRYSQEKESLLNLAKRYNSSVVVSASTTPFDPTPPSKFEFTTANKKVIDNSGNQSAGFSDETGKYPLYTKEPDTNRLARNNKISETQVTAKEKSRVQKVNTALGAAPLWDEPLSPYNARYPFNHVYQSESGHLLEFDDTENAERVHIYHKAGTYVEIDRNGRMVRKIVGDGFEIIERNGYVYVGGRCNITIGGDANISVAGDLNAEVGGDTEVYANNDVTFSVGGSCTFSVNENLNISAGSVKIESKSGVDIFASADYKITAGGLVSTQGSGLAHDGGLVKLNSGASIAAVSLNITSKPRVSSQKSEFPDQDTSYRTAEAVFYGELEEDNTVELKETLIANGVATKQQLETKPIETNEMNKLESQFSGDTVKVDCAQIAMLDSFPTTLQLSPNYTLGSLMKTAVSNAILQDQFGLTKAEIVCNLQALALNVIEPVKRKYPNMIVTSCLRNENAKSQHTRGEAVDMQFTGVPKDGYYEIATILKDLIPFDQLLLEYKTFGTGMPWIHVSFSRNANKKQVLTFFNNAKHSVGLVNLV